MKRLAVILLACLTMPAPALEVSGRVLTLTEDEIEQCRDGGGCVFVTREKLLEAIENQSRKMAGSCGNRT